MKPLTVWRVAKFKASRAGFQSHSLSPIVRSKSDPAELQPNISGDKDAIFAELRDLAEQVRSSEIALADLQCEFEALRAENTWLKRAHVSDCDRSLQPQSTAVDSDHYPESEDAAAFIFDVRRKMNSFYKPVLYACGAVALFLAGFLSGYLAFRESSFISPAVVQSDSPTAAHGIMAAPVPITDPAPDFDLKRATDTSSKAVPLKKRPASRAADFYKVVRSTEVRSQPNASSKPLAQIAPGMAVKVVAIRGEWLEVQSLYGRPPGFIHKDTAVKDTTG
jgi:hypothetical protein